MRKYTRVYLPGMPSHSESPSLSPKRKEAPLKIHNVARLGRRAKIVVSLSCGHGPLGRFLAQQRAQPPSGPVVVQKLAVIRRLIRHSAYFSLLTLSTFAQSTFVRAYSSVS